MPRTGDAIAAVDNEKPSLVVLDVNLPGKSGYEVCRELRAKFGDEIPILFVSGDRIEALDRVAGLLLGGDDYLVKPFDPDELLARARRLMRSKVLSDGVPLTNRDREVLTLLSESLSTAAIARKLVVAPSTVSKHIERIFQKLTVHTRAEAVARANQTGLLQTFAA